MPKKLLESFFTGSEPQKSSGACGETRSVNRKLYAYVLFDKEIRELVRRGNERNPYVQPGQIEVLLANRAGKNDNNEALVRLVGRKHDD
jgi:hypothetical protein